MRSFQSIFVCVLTLLMSAQAFAQSGPVYYNNFQSVDHLMDRLRIENPDVYAKLLPQFKDMEVKQSTSQTLLITGLVVGGLITTGGFIAYAAGGTSDNQDSIQTVGMVTAVTGVGIMTLGGILAALNKPTRYEIESLYKRHQKLNPDNPIRIGFDIKPPLPSSPSMAMNLNIRF